MKTLMMILILMTANLAMAQDYSFINLRVRAEDRATSIDRFNKELEPDFINRLKSTLFVKLLSEYPDLKNLPTERFAEIFTFDLDLNWWSGGDAMGGASVVTFVKDGAGVFSQHPVRITNKSPVEFAREDISQGTWDIKPLGLIETSNHSLPAILGGTVLGEDLPVEVFEQLAWEAVSKASFSRQLPPNQMRQEILVRLPELEMYIGGLTEKLRLVLQNPKAFETELVKKSAEIEKKLTELYNKHQITKQEADERVAKLHGDVLELESRATAARAAVELAGRQHQALKPVMEAVLRGSTRGNFEVARQASNLEILGHRGNPSEVNAVINGVLNQALFQMLQLKGAEWKSIYSALTIEAAVIGIEVVEGKKGVFTNEADTYKIQIALTAQARTHSHSEIHQGLVTLTNHAGTTHIDEAGRTELNAFFTDVERGMDDVVLKEKTSPAGTFIAQLLQRNVDVEQIAEALKTGKPVVTCEQILTKTKI